MRVDSNQNLSFDRPDLFMGYADDLELIAVCPDRQTLEKLTNRTIDKDPVYLTKVDGKDQLRLELWFRSTKAYQNEDGQFQSFMVSRSFFLKRVKAVRQNDGSQVYIDKCGRSGFKDDKGEYFSYGAEHAEKGLCRVAMEGEAQLAKFMRDLLNAKSEGLCEVYDGTPEEANVLFSNKGIVGIRTFLLENSKTIIGRLFIREEETEKVKDGKKQVYKNYYQDMYHRINRGWQPDVSYIEKAFQDFVRNSKKTIHGALLKGAMLEKFVYPAGSGGTGGGGLVLDASIAYGEGNGSTATYSDPTGGDPGTVLPPTVGVYGDHGDEVDDLPF